MPFRRILCVGCFDILHYGHLLHLEASYAMGDELVVGITRNRCVDKGAGRPYNDERLRAALVQAIWCVEKVRLVDSSLQALKLFNPDIFALGADYKGNVLPEDRAYCKRNGIKIRFTNKRRMSSTDIYDRLRQR